MGNLLSPGHLLLVLLIALLLFGPSRLPELGRAFGRTLKEFKDGTRDGTRDGTVLPGEEEETSGKSGEM